MPGFFRATKLTSVAAAAALASAAVVPSGARAAVVISIEETGSDVIATTSGTLDLTGLNYTSDGGSYVGLIDPFYPIFSSTGGSASFYYGLTGVVSFGSGDATGAYSSSGDLFYLNGDGLIAVPFGYVSNTALSATTTFSSATLASLGLAAGTYVFSTPADSVTVRFGILPAVPEPATWAMMLIGFGGIGLALRRRRPLVLRESA